MRLLLDTHTFLWAASDKPRLSPTALKLIEDPDNDLLLSIASVWEICIKYSTGKLKLSQPPDLFVTTQLSNIRIELLPLELRHVVLVASLPFHHRDPFDRVLVAQCLIDNLPIICADAALDVYGIDRQW